jgi:C-terminal processing protease CtpA/Prc
MKAGDELLTIEGFAVDREGASKLEYAMVVLMPRSSLKLDLRDPTGKVTQITVNGSVKTRSSVAGLGDSTWNINEGIMHRENAWEKERAKYREFGNELMILKVPAFVETSGDVDALFRRARSHKALIVDVRGCPGGLVDSVLDYLGDIFPHDVNVGNWVHRNKVDHLMAKANRRDAFNGDLIVLVDSETASGGEIFAKMVQLQERGTILGDHSSGKTMESVGHGHHYGDNPIYYYGDSITVADTVMPDGKSLEHVGVEPDRTMLPAPADIAAKRDPVLAYAAGLEGVKISPEDAAKLFPENDSDK